MRRRSQASAVVASQFIGVLLKFITFTLLAQIGGIEIAGLYTGALAIVTPIFSFASMNLRNVYLSLTGATYKSILTLRVLYLGAGAIFVAVVGVVLYQERLGLLLWLSLYKCAELLIDGLIAYHQKRDQLLAMAANTVVFSLAANVSIWVVFALTQSLHTSIAASGFFGIIVAGCSALTILRKYSGADASRFARLKVPARDFAAISKAGLMLSISSSAVAFSTSLPVLFISEFGTDHDVGMYSAIYYISSVSNILYTSVAQIELHRFVTLVQKSDFKAFARASRRLRFRLSGVGAIGFVAVALFGVQLFSAVFGADFSDQRLALLIMGGFIVISPWGFILDIEITALRGYGVQARIAGINLIVTAIAGALLIPRYLVLGGTLTVLFALVVRVVAKRSWVLRTLGRQS